MRIAFPIELVVVHNEKRELRSNENVETIRDLRHILLAEELQTTSVFNPITG